MQPEPKIATPVQPIAAQETTQAPAVAKKRWETPRVIVSEMRETETGLNAGYDGTPVAPNS